MPSPPPPTIRDRAAEAGERVRRGVHTVADHVGDVVDRFRTPPPPDPSLHALALQQDTTKSRLRNDARWPSLAEIYDTHLHARRHEVERVLEIGVETGGSLLMWREFFPNAHIFGVDMRKPKRKLGDRITLILGDQSDAEFRTRLAADLAPLDVIVDDGSHKHDDQRETLIALWPALRPGGVYIVEDVHTSYRDRFGGGRGTAGTFVEWAKGLFDDIHEREHHEDVSLAGLETVSVYYGAMILRKWLERSPAAT
jgi:SAM-dependent methyltransferase